MAQTEDIKILIRHAQTGLDSVRESITALDRYGEETEQLTEQANQLDAQLGELSRQDKLINDFADLKRSTAQTGEQFHDAKERATALGRELAQTTQPSARLKESFRKARAESNRLERAWIKQNATLNDTRRTLRAAGVDTQNFNAEQRELRRQAAATGESLDQLSDELQQQQRELVETSAATETLGSKIRQLGRSARDNTASLRGMGRRAAAVAMRFGPLAAAVGAAGAAATAAAAAFGSLFAGGYLEQMRLQVRAVTDSTSEARQEFKRLLQITRQTPAEIKDVVEVYTVLKRRGLDPTTEAMMALIRANIRAGGTQSDLINLAQTLGEAWAKQTIEVSTLNQMAERGIPAWHMLADAMGVSVAQLKQMAQAGKLGRQQISLLIDEINAASTGALQRHMQSLKGLVTTVGEQFLKFGNLVAKSGLMEFAKTQLQDLIGLFRDAAENGYLQVWAQRISDALVAMGQRLRTLVEWVGTNFDTIIRKSKAVGSAVYNSIALIVNVVQFAGNTIGEVISGIVGTAVRGADLIAGALSKIGLVSDQTARQVHLMYEAFRDANAAYDKAAQDAFNDAKKSLQGLADAYHDFGNAAGTAARQAQRDFEALLNTISKAGQISALTAAQKKLTRWLDQGRISMDQYRQAVQALALQQRALAAATADAATATQQQAQVAQQAQAKLDALHTQLRAGTISASDYAAAYKGLRRELAAAGVELNQAVEATAGKAQADDQAAEEVTALNNALDENADKYVRSGRAANYAAEQTRETAEAYEQTEHSARDAAEAIGALVDRTQAYFRERWGQDSADELNQALHGRGNSLDDFLRISNHLATLNEWGLGSPNSPFASQQRPQQQPQQPTQQPTQRYEINLNGPTGRTTLYADDRQSVDDFLGQLEQAGMTASGWLQ